jgi:hypothetical protein
MAIQSKIERKQLQEQIFLNLNFFFQNVLTSIKQLW